tara:strand:- start:63 stop:527 length:465 start_codon:yes stop_codon:yes gene_type:complete
MSSTLLFTINKQRLLVPLYGVMVAACICLNYLFVLLGWGITGVALGTSISYFLFFLIIFTYAACHIMEWKEIVMFHFEIMIFYIYFLINILWIDAVINFPNIILTVILKLSCFLLVSIPVLISVQRRERIFSLIVEVLKHKIFSGKLDAKFDSK